MTMAKHTLPDDRRVQLCEWLTANDIDPRGIMYDSDLSIIDTDDGRAIRYEMTVRNADGRIVLDDRGERVATEMRTVPLKTEPPEWWQPYVKPTREQLLDVVRQVSSLHHGPRTERHGSCCVHCGLVWPCPTVQIVAAVKEPIR